MKPTRKELNFKRCYVNGKKSGVASYDNGGAALLYFGHSLGDGLGEVATKKLGQEVGTLHQFNNYIELSAATVAGIQAVLPGAVVEFEGSKEYNARVSAAVGSRGGSSSSVVPAPVVVSSDAFRAPVVDDCAALKGLIFNMSAVVDAVNAWSVEYSTAALNGGAAVDAPGCIDAAALFIPELPSTFAAFRVLVDNAIKEYREKQAAERAAREAAERAAREAAERSAREAAAAAKGKQLITLSDGSTVEVTGRVHPAFSEVLEDLKDFKRVYLYGNAGTGKSFMAKQLAEVLGVPCEISGQTVLKYDLIGTIDANGKHISTPFTRAAMNGGVWLWDEYDRSSPDATTAINDALANGQVDIPGVGMVELHENFYMLAAGNTCGFGGSSKYVAAQQQDYSSLTRFLSKIHIGYCREIDMIVSGNNSELCDFVAAVRAAIEVAGIEIDIPIRALQPLQRKAARSGKVRALEACLFAGIGATQVKQIAARVNGSGAWFDALKEYAEKVA